ncbi:MAG: RluA family pseudouridine synthase [Lachnospiraceae bacterium]|nr:RluA family pseudouridine synthase [Lachnospiraceae bacterium]
MVRSIDYTIPASWVGNIQQFLKSKGYSTQSLIALKKEPDNVLLDGHPVYLTAKAIPGNLLTIHIREDHSSEHIAPVPLPLDIVYEDEDLLIVNKPAGMPIHPSQNNHDNSLANALAWYFARQNRPFVFRCVNRLDRDTSGLTIIAKHHVSAAILSAGLSDKASSGLEREYLAIVKGYPTPAVGTIDMPLGRKEGSIIERIPDPAHGERAVTHYRVLETQNGHSLVSLLLETGRTHQIRVHMKYLGYPLIGDYLYNPDMEQIQRQALHAHRLCFTHPITGQRMEFISPLPPDMYRVLYPDA